MNDKNTAMRQKIYHKEIDKTQIAGEVKFTLNKNSYLKQIDIFYKLYIHVLYQIHKKWGIIFCAAVGFIGLALLNFILQKNIGYKVPSIIQQIINYGVAISLVLITFIGIRIIKIMGDVKSEKNSRLKIAQRYSFSSPFEYKFYADGLVILEPFQGGTFEWTDFSKISSYGDFVVFTFKSSDIKGYEWTRGFMDIIISTEIMQAVKVDMSVFRDLKTFEEC